MWGCFILDKSVSIKAKMSVACSEKERSQPNKIQKVALSLQASLGSILERLKTKRLDFIVSGLIYFLLL